MYVRCVGNNTVQAQTSPWMHLWTMMERGVKGKAERGWRDRKKEREGGTAAGGKRRETGKR